MKYCGRCDQPIRDGEQYTSHDIFSPSGPGTTVYQHVHPCRKTPTQTSQYPTRY